MDNGLLHNIHYGEIILPSEIYVAVGRQCNLWWSTAAVYEEGDRSVYFEVKCDVGITTARGFVLNATAEMVGSHELIIRSRQLHTRKILSECKVKLIVTKTGMGDGCRNIMMMGDSRTWHSVDGVQGYTLTAEGNKATTTEVRALLDANEGAVFTFIGDHTSETNENVKNFADNGRQYVGARDIIAMAGGIRKFVENNCGTKKGTALDYVTVMFGINDLADWHENNLDQYELCLKKFDWIVDSAKSLVDSILKGYPECNIIFVLEPSTAGNQDGYGYWGASDNDCQQEMEFAVKALRKRIIEEFDCQKYSANITMSSAGLWCDRVYGYPYLYEPASVRCPESKVIHLHNCVHPHNNGYYQIADGVFSTIEYLESK